MRRVRFGEMTDRVIPVVNIPTISGMIGSAKNDSKELSHLDGMRCHLLVHKRASDLGLLEFAGDGEACYNGGSMQPYVTGRDASL